MDLLVIRGNSMYPIFKDGEEIKLKKISNKVKIKIGDVVCFEGFNNKILIKEVVAVPNDSFKIEKNILIVNDKYNFEVSEDTILKEFEKNFSGVLPENNYIVLGKTTKSIDSSKFGPILKNSIIGIVK